jgi:hypothetical protein
MLERERITGRIAVMVHQIHGKLDAVLPTANTRQTASWLVPATRFPFLSPDLFLMQIMGLMQ